jgi:hypothetical protein
VLLLKQIIKASEPTLAEDYLNRLHLQHNLAGAYRVNGQVKEAVLLLKRVVKIRKQTLIKDHPDRLASQYILAGAYRANG